MYSNVLNIKFYILGHINENIYLLRLFSKTAYKKSYQDSTEVGIFEDP